MFFHAWDLADHSLNYLMDWMSKARLNTMCFAATYHSGWFIHPNSPRHRAFQAESGACYFHPRKTQYKTSPLLVPMPSKITKKKDWLLEASVRAQKHGLRLFAWVIGTHNSRLGLAFPELTQQNVFGDRLPHALCPANEAVYFYLQNICRDIARNYPVWAIQLESFGWLGFAHGHHHERDLVGLTELEQDLMGLCVCLACSKKSEAAGVDILGVKTIVKSILINTFREAPQRPHKHPRTMAELEVKSPALKQFNTWRKNYLNTLLFRIKRHALAGTDCRLVLQTGFDPAIVEFIDGFACGAYKKDAKQTLAISQKFTLHIPQNWPGLKQCFIQLGMGIPKNRKQLHDIITAAINGGCNGLNFYNHSESPPKMLGWLSEVLPEFS